MCKKIGPSFWRNIATAICHATGKRVRDLPITLDKLQRWKSRWLVHGPDAQVMICGQLESHAAKPGLLYGIVTSAQEVKREFCQSIAIRSRRSARPDERHPPSATLLARNRCAAIDRGQEIQHE